METLVNVLSYTERCMFLQNLYNVISNEINVCQERTSQLQKSIRQLGKRFLEKDTEKDSCKNTNAAIILLYTSRMMFELQDVQFQLQTKSTWRDNVQRELLHLCDNIRDKFAMCIQHHNEFNNIIPFDESILFNQVLLIFENCNRLISSEFNNQKAQIH